MSKLDTGHLFSLVLRPALAQRFRPDGGGRRGDDGCGDNAAAHADRLPADGARGRLGEWVLSFLNYQITIRLYFQENLQGNPLDHLYAFVDIKTKIAFVYRVTHQVAHKLLTQGCYGFYIGLVLRVWEQPDVSPC